MYHWGNIAQIEQCGEREVNDESEPPSNCFEIIGGQVTELILEEDDNDTGRVRNS